MSFPKGEHVMPFFLKKLFLYDPYGAGEKSRRARRDFERVARTVQSETNEKELAACFAQVGRNIKRAIGKGLEG
jgi:hypothetical protein